MALTAAEKQRRYRDRHPERVKAAVARHYAENREAELARGKRWRAENPEKRAAWAAAYNQGSSARDSQAKYHAANRERRLADNKRWRESNRERRATYLRSYWHVRRARKRGAVGQCSEAQWQARFAYYGGKCWMCKHPAETVDHVKALAAGGSNWPANLRPACRSCNSAKGARSWRLYTH